MKPVYCYFDSKDASLYVSSDFLAPNPPLNSALLELSRYFFPGGADAEMQAQNLATFLDSAFSMIAHGENVDCMLRNYSKIPIGMRIWEREINAIPSAEANIESDLTLLIKPTSKFSEIYPAILPQYSAPQGSKIRLAETYTLR